MLTCCCMEGGSSNLRDAEFVGSQVESVATILCSANSILRQDKMRQLSCRRGYTKFNQIFVERY